MKTKLPKSSKDDASPVRTRVISKLLRHFSQQALQATGSATAKALGKRQKGCLGACAILRAHPFSVPLCVPRLCEALTRHVGDPYPIGEAVKETLTHFKRTHQDVWERVVVRTFSPEQMAAMQGVLASPHYYA